MQIQGAVHIHGPQALQGPHRTSLSPASANSSPQVVDQLDLSREAQELSQTRQSGQIRHDLVNRVRQEIAAGVYDTDQKLDVALDRLLDELG